MNESYSKKISSINNYINLDKLTKLICEADEMEDDVFSEIDNANYSPSQDTLNKIYACL